MKESLKFAFVCFGVSLLIVIAAYMLCPRLYSGETFLVVWFYVANVLLGSWLFPVFSKIIRRRRSQNRTEVILSHFVAILLIINILSLIFFQRLYTASMIIAIFRKPEIRALAIVELLNPVVSFGITYVLFRKSSLWEIRR